MKWFIMQQINDHYDYFNGKSEYYKIKIKFKILKYTKVVNIIKIH